MANDLLQLWKSIQPMAEKDADTRTRDCVRMRKMTVTTAYNATTKTIGVSIPFGEEVQLPVWGGLNPAILSVNDTAWALVPYSDFSNAIVFMGGNGATGSIPPGRNLVNDTGTAIVTSATGGTGNYTASYLFSEYALATFAAHPTATYTAVMDLALEWTGAGSPTPFTPGSTGSRWTVQFAGTLIADSTYYPGDSGLTEHVELHFTPTNTQLASASTTNGLRVRMLNIPVGYQLTITNCKLELGPVATEWTPSPEDTIYQTAKPWGTFFVSGSSGGGVQAFSTTAYAVPLEESGDASANFAVWFSHSTNSTKITARKACAVSLSWQVFFRADEGAGGKTFTAGSYCVAELYVADTKRASTTVYAPDALTYQTGTGGIQVSLSVGDTLEWKVRTSAGDGNFDKGQDATYFCIKVI